MIHKQLLKTVALVAALSVPATAVASEPFRTVNFPSGDGLEITADLYDGAGPTSGTVVLFHQSGSSRGEFRTTGARIAALGFNALAVDLRWGRTWAEVRNETAARHGTDAIMNAVEAGDASPWPTIDASYEDMRAALEWLDVNGYTGPVYALGSSFSATLALRLGAEEHVDAVLAYSPGEYDDSRPEMARGWAARLEIPLYAVAAPDEAALVGPVFEAASSAGSRFFQAIDGDHGASVLDAGSSNWQDLASYLSGLWGGLPNRREVVIATSADGDIYADEYMIAEENPTILLFHQGGGSARGEYGFLIPYLLELEYNVIAPDLYGGGDRFGEPNRTMAARPEPVDFSFCDAEPGVVAVLEYGRTRGQGPIVLWGSSYSAALVVTVGAKQPENIAAVLAFSAAGGEPMTGCRPESSADKLTMPTLVVRPRTEMEIDSVREQMEALQRAGLQSYVTATGSHGSSVLNSTRTGEGSEAARVHALEFLARALAGADGSR